MKIDEHKKTEWLYGDYTPPPIPRELARRRIEALEKHLAELLEISFWERDDARIRDVLAARDFWTKFAKGVYK